MSVLMRVLRFLPLLLAAACVPPDKGAGDSGLEAESNGCRTMGGGSGTSTSEEWTYGDSC